MRQRDATVEIFGKGFQVDIGGVDVVVDVVEGFARDVAVGDHHSFDAVFFRGAANVDDVFAPDGRLVVGEGDRRAAVADGEHNDVFGRHVARNAPDRPDLEMSQFWQKKQPMLQPAVPMRKHLRAGQEMIERLFLDGIDLQRGGAP